MRSLAFGVASLFIVVGSVGCSGTPPSDIVFPGDDAGSSADGSQQPQSDASTPGDDAASTTDACATTCGGHCTDLTTDVNHCGACGNECGAGKPPLVGGGIWQCAQSQCKVACSSASLSACDDGCHDLASEPDHCGTCGTTCSASSTCCGGSCANTQTDNANCGQCGDVCGGTCKAGACCSKPTTGTCIHDPCTVGYALGASCDGTQGCVAKVCANDSYCCAVGWDTKCTTEITTYCAPLQCKC